MKIKKTSIISAIFISYLFFVFCYINVNAITTTTTSDNSHSLIIDPDQPPPGKTACELNNGKCGLFKDACTAFGLKELSQYNKSCEDDGTGYVCCEKPIVACAAGTCRPESTGCISGEERKDYCNSTQVCCISTTTSTDTAVAAVATVTATASATTPTASAATNYAYTPMESIPGFGKPADFPTYISAVYKFGLWTIGISALLMILIGGYTYLTSAGNASQTGKAKGYIVDAIIGLILALVSWLLLYTINPDLVNFQSLSGSGSAIDTRSGTGVGTGTSTGNCSPATVGPCTVANLQNTCMGSNAIKASSICKAESGGNAVPSGVDICKGDDARNAASWGLFQINLTNHKIGGLDCPSAFSGGAYTADNHNCKVIDQTLYNKCVSAAKDSAKNISAACEISKNGAKWGQWGANKSCKF